MKVNGTRLLKALLENTKPVVVFEGSMRSTKTISILQWLVLLGHSKKKAPLVFRVFRRHGVTCRKTVAKDFKVMMKSQFPKLWNNGENYNKSDACYTFEDGSELYFAGCDDVDALHGETQDIAVLNEVMSIGYSSYNQIAPRTRMYVVMDFNPSVTRHWVFEKVLTMDKSRVLYVHSTYRDNKFLTPEQVYHIEKWEPNEENINAKTADKWLWEVYGLGKRARREGAILKNWDVCEKFPDKYVCQRYGYGLDFGFSNDPTALVECALFQDQLYFRQLIYETGLTTLQNPNNPSIKSLQKRLEELEICKTDPIIADCARPDNIESLRLLGYNIIPCKKGEGTIVSGLDLLNTFTSHIYINSMDLQFEAENYVWKINPFTEEVKPIPEDKNNHAIDAMRYFTSYMLGTERLQPRKMKKIAYYSEFYNA